MSGGSPNLVPLVLSIVIFLEQLKEKERNVHVCCTNIVH